MEALLKRSKFVSALCSLLSISLFASNCVFLYANEVNLWKERQKSIQTARLPKPWAVAGSVGKTPPLVDPFGSKESSLKSLVLSFPARLGSIRHVSIPKSGRGPVLIHIQDVHRNLEAQKNIGLFLQSLIEKKHVDLVALEGAFAPIPLSAFREFPDQVSVRRVADSLLAEHKISGPIHAAFSSESALPPIVGVDDPERYQANVDAFRTCAPSIENIKRQLALEENNLTRQKAAFYSHGLLSFDSTVQDYREGRLSLGDYVQFLSTKASRVSPEVTAFLKTLALEKSLNFPRVESERSLLLGSLVSKLGEKTSRDALRLSAAFRGGLMSQADFYLALQEMCASAGLDMGRFKAMASYIEYVAMADRIEPETLLRSVHELEESLYHSQISSAQEKRIQLQDRQLALTEKLVDFSLTAEEWGEYKAIVHSQLNLSSFERFYFEAEARDKAMFANLKKAMAAQKTNVVVLVTGGFHSSGMKQLASEAGLTTISFVPRITKVDSPTGPAYLSVFTQEKTPLEKLFIGSKLFLAEPPISKAVSLEAGFKVIAWAHAVRSLSNKQLARWAERLLPMKRALIQDISRSAFRLIGFIPQAGGAAVRRVFQVTVAPSSDPRQPGPVLITAPPAFMFDGLARRWFSEDSFQYAFCAAILGPYLETLLALAFSFGSVWFLDAVGFGGSALTRGAMLGLYGVLFSLAHPDLWLASTYEGGRTGRETAKRFFVRALLGIIFIGILPNQNGFYLSFSSHGFYNLAILAARTEVRFGRMLIPLLNRVNRFLAALPLATLVKPKSKQRKVHATMSNAAPETIIVGTVVKYDWTSQKDTRVTHEILSDDGVKAELAKFDAAVASLLDKLKGQSNLSRASALATYLINSFQRNLRSELESDIQKQRLPAWVLLGPLIERFANQEQGLDREMVLFGQSILSRLKNEELPRPQMKGNDEFILVMKGDRPDPFVMGQIIEENHRRLRAIVWEGKFELYHWVTLLAEEYGISVLGRLDSKLFDFVNEGDLAIVDSGDQIIETNPIVAHEETAQAAALKLKALNEVYLLDAGKQAWTADTDDQGVWKRIVNPVGVVVKNFPAEDEIAVINEQANGFIGLFRTEFLYPRDKAIPTEEWLASHFTKTADQLNGMVTVRAIDRQRGDKDDDVFADELETTFGMKFLLESQVGLEVYKAQCRAVLRAFADSKKHNLRFVAPLVTGVEQAQKALAVFEQAKKELLEQEGVDARSMEFGVTLGAEIESELILDLSSIRFVYIGTGDFIRSTGASDVLHPEFLNAVRHVVMMAQTRGKGVTICGAYAADKHLMLFVNSLPLDESKPMPGWAILPAHIPGRKAFIRQLNQKKLQRELGEMDRETGKRIVELTAQNDKELQRRTIVSAAYGHAYRKLAIQKGIRMALMTDFERDKDERLQDVVSVRVKQVVKRMTPGGGKHISSENADRVGFDYTFMNVVGRIVAGSLRYASKNGNRANVFLARLRQNFVDKLILGNSTTMRVTVVASEGRREGKGQITMPVGAELGFGQQMVDAVLLSMEGSQALVHSLEKKNGTLVARAFGKAGSFVSLPDAYMFKVVVSPQLDGINVAELLRGTQIPNSDQVNQEKMVHSLFDEAADKINRPLNVGVLFRPRHKALISALAKQMGISESYETMENEVKHSAGQCLFKGTNGILELYENDDWSSGLSMGPGGVDVWIGSGGTPEAIMSAVLVKKLGGRFAGVLVPADGLRYSVNELRLMARFEGLDPRRVFDQDGLVPGRPDDIACMAGILRDYERLGETIPGPHVDDSGHVIGHVLWVGSQEVLDVEIKFRTSINKYRKLLEGDLNDAARRCDLAVAYADFGRYHAALRVLDGFSRPPNGLDALRVDVVRAYILGTKEMAEGKGKAEEICLRALVRYESALRLIRSHGEFESLNETLDIQGRIRHIYFWLRDNALQISDALPYGNTRTSVLRRAFAYSKKALSYSKNGFETLRRDNSMRLRSLVDEYNNIVGNYWLEMGRDPDLETRIRYAFGVYERRRSDEALKTYGRSLRDNGTFLWVAYFYETVIAENTLADQANIMSWFLSDNRARQCCEDMEKFILPTEDAVVLTFSRLVSKALEQHSVKDVERRSSAVSSDVSRANRVLMWAKLPVIWGLLGEKFLKSRGQDVLWELYEVAKAKAAILPALGNHPGRQTYLEEAVRYAEMVIDDPNNVGIKPIEMLFDIAFIYDDIAMESRRAYDIFRARQFYTVVSEKAPFVEYMQGRKNASGRRIYNDGEIAAMNEFRMMYLMPHLNRIRERLQTLGGRKRIESTHLEPEPLILGTIDLSGQPSKMLAMNEMIIDHLDRIGVSWTGLEDVITRFLNGVFAQASDIKNKKSDLVLMPNYVEPYLSIAIDSFNPSINIEEQTKEFGARLQEMDHRVRFGVQRQGRWILFRLFFLKEGLPFPQSILGMWGGWPMVGFLAPLLEEALRTYSGNALGVPPVLWALVLFPVIHALLHIVVDWREGGGRLFLQRMPQRILLSMGFGLAAVVSPYPFLSSFIVHALSNTGVYFSRMNKPGSGSGWIMSAIPALPAGRDVRHALNQLFPKGEPLNLNVGDTTDGRYRERFFPTFGAAMQSLEPVTRQTDVRVFHIGEAPDPSLVEGELNEAEEALAAVENVNAQGRVTSNIIFITHPGLPESAVAHLDQLIKKRAVFASRISSIDVPFDGEFRSYNRLLERMADSAGAQNLAAVRDLVQGHYADGRFVVRSKRPGEFRATGDLERIWMMIVNIGLGWRIYEPGQVDLMLKSIQIIQFQA